MNIRPGNSEKIPHVCIVTGSHLWRNPRVVKEADALTDAGFKVTVVGPIVNERDQARDLCLLENRKWQRIAAPDMLASSMFNFKRFRYRASRRVSLSLVRYLRLPIAGSLGYGISETIRTAESLQADIYSCHLEVGLVALRHLDKQGLTCAVDLEDWYSKDLLPMHQRDRPIALLEQLEKYALQNAKATFTTSESLSKALSEKNDSSLPVVIYNAFKLADRANIDGAIRDRKNPEIPSLLWFSQTIGPGRGLEELIDAVMLIEREFELHIRGDGSDTYKQGLLSRLPIEKRTNIFFHATTNPDELLSRIAEHDVGLALEARVPLNKDVTISNKIFQYMLAGCAVVASRTSGQEEAQALFPGAISLVDLERNSIAAALVELMENPERLGKAKASALEAARTSASWEVVAMNIINAYRGILNAR